MFVSRGGHGWAVYHNVTYNTGVVYCILFEYAKMLHVCVCVCRQKDLFRVLKAYTLYRPEEGYCQAQAPIAAVLLMHMPAEVRIAFNTNTHHHSPYKLCPLVWMIWTLEDLLWSLKLKSTLKIEIVLFLLFCKSFRLWPRESIFELNCRGTECTNDVICRWFPELLHSINNTSNLRLW